MAVDVTRVAVIRRSPEDPSVYTPEGRIEQARRFGMGWKSAARWKRRGLLLVSLISITFTAITFLIYLIVRAIQNLL